MRRTGWKGWFAALVLVAMAGCSDLAWERGRVLLWWEAHEMLFALSPQSGRVDGYRLHGGVLHTGGVVLPAGACFDTLRFDPRSARLWVLGADGGLLVDARRMKVLAQWQGAEAPAPPPETALAGRAEETVAAVCPAPWLARSGAL